ncbi:MAG: glycosyl hydrolase family 18 protein [Bacteroidota bacterium]|nr:glycosyl hydrolase family 18 protein [Bacteroidota bacterium]MDP4213719.1 glycosyl hydrolase family 18 protein [Bacteroidota bacterium]MDP4248572.1 glycosyl hydrolase family 18 protein [Bacteroidota bacterium]
MYIHHVTRSLIFSWLFVGSLAAQPSANIQVIAYYSGGISQLDSIDVGGISHLIYCFGHLDGHRYKIAHARDSAIIRKMVSLKEKQPDLKVILSMGGWGGCENCSDGFSTSKGRKEFAESVKEVSDYFHTDGIDLDWEYPTIRLDNDIDKNPVHKTSPEDKANFTDLVRQLRAVLGKTAEISFAAGGFTTYLEGSVDWAAVMPEVNYVNLMTYDLINGYAKETGHHTALYSTPHQKESTDHAVQYLVGIGVDPAKIIIGAAFYARVWGNVPDKNHGLYQPGNFKHGIAYKEFPKRLSPKAGYITYWDNTAKAPYAYNKKDSLFATYDDKRSIKLKTEYVIRHKLGGIMFWELGLDTYKDGLLDTIEKTRESFPSAR